jgi:sugar phosphate isomerase/epimerase
MIDNIGVCTWTFGGNTLPDTLSRIARLGAKGVELFGDVGAWTPADVKRWLQTYDLALYSVTPANVDIAHPDNDVREAALRYYFRLVDFSAELGQPIISCHGFVSRYSAISSQADESSLLATSVRDIANYASRSGLNVVFEVLNRYETHLINTADQALGLLEEVAVDNLSILLDAYHMNIEERDPVASIHHVGNKLGLYHAADSNREAIGNGHVDFASQLQALAAINYHGPVILECTAPGPDPFTPEKGQGYLENLERHLKKSISWLRQRK